MKHIKFLSVLLALFAILLSACGSTALPVASQDNAAPKVQASVVFTGAVESISGSQWVVNGQTIMVDPSVIRDGSFQVGDTIKMEIALQSDGSVAALRVELPSAADLAEISTQAPPLTSNVAGTPSQNLVFNAGGDEAFGTVDAITDMSITVGGQTFNFVPGTEIKNEIIAGAFVKLHFIVNLDGTLSVLEVGTSDPSQIGNGNDDNSNVSNSNDDNSNDSNVNDDNGGNSNDDSGGNSNDDSGGNSNDDSGGGNDDSGGGNDGGGDNGNGGG